MYLKSYEPDESINLFTKRYEGKFGNFNYNVNEFTPVINEEEFNIYESESGLLYERDYDRDKFLEDVYSNPAKYDNLIKGFGIAEGDYNKIPHDYRGPILVYDDKENDYVESKNAFHCRVNGFEGIMCMTDNDNRYRLNFISKDACDYLDREPYKLDISKNIVDEDSKRKMLYGKDDRNFVHFGIMTKVEEDGHEPGYVWASRPAVFANYGKEQAVECTINGRPAYITLDEAKKVVMQAKGQGCECDLIRTDSVAKDDKTIVETNYSVRNKNIHNLEDFKTIFGKDTHTIEYLNLSNSVDKNASYNKLKQMRNKSDDEQVIDDGLKGLGE